MCVLCGEALVHIHWTDSRLHTSIDRPDQDKQQRLRLHDRRHLVQLANHILLYYGLRLDDWSGSKYVLSDKKGRSEIVQDSGDLWFAAEKLIHRAPDPLDAALLEALTLKKM